MMFGRVSSSNTIHIHLGGGFEILTIVPRGVR
jgi:hypothetical protein